MSITWGYTSSLTRTANVWVPKSATMTDEESATIKSKLAAAGVAY